MLGGLTPGEELPPIRTLALQLKVTPNTIVRAYDELEAAGVIHKRRGSGSFVSEVRHSRLADVERHRLIEQRIDALLAEAHQLNFTADDVLRVIRERRAVMKRAIKCTDGEVAMADTIVDVNEISRSFGAKRALDHVTFRATEGKVYGLVGSNGAGKTTLIKHLLGLLRVQSGMVRVFGRDPVRDPVGVLSRVGYLSEERELPEWMSVEELMRYTQAFHPTWDASYVRELLRASRWTSPRKSRTSPKACAHRPDSWRPWPIVPSC